MSSTTSNRDASSTAYFANDFDGRWAALDHPHFYYDPSFKEFCARELTALESLREGWDASGAPPIEPQVLAAAREFITALPDHIATRPMVVPMSSGGLQFEWHAGRRILELEFESPVLIHYLKWDPDCQVEEEDVLPVSSTSELVDLIRWFMKGMLSD